MIKVIKKYKKFFVITLAFLVVFSGTLPVNADNGDNGDYVKIPNPVRFESINDFLIELTNLLIQLGLALVIFMVVLGGFYIMISGGNPQQYDKGKNIIKWTVLGVFVVIFARAILALIRFAIGG